VVDVDTVEAVVPADGTITLRSSGRGRRRRPLASSTRTVRKSSAALFGATGAPVRIVWRAAVVTLALGGRAGASAAVWARPCAASLARLAGAIAVTAALFVATLAHALADAAAAYARFVTEERARRRS
jgi:hypothetical protein